MQLSFQILAAAVLLTCSVAAAPAALADGFCPLYILKGHPCTEPRYAHCPCAGAVPEPPVTKPFAQRSSMDVENHLCPTGFLQCGGHGCLPRIHGCPVIKRDSDDVENHSCPAGYLRCGSYGCFPEVYGCPVVKV